MLFSSRLSLNSLSDLCRGMRHGLSAGLGLREVFNQQATRGLPSVRPVAHRIYRRLDHGDSLEDALANEERVFPPLFVTMVTVGEQTGHLPEVFRELENYFQMQRKLRRQFVAQTFPSILQFIIALGIVAILIFVLGHIGDPRNPMTLFGLRGARGTLIFLGVVLGVFAVLFLFFLVVQRVLRGRPAVERLLLATPFIGPCVRAFALARFALALRLTLDSELPVARAARLSLESTGNSAFASLSDPVARTLKSGDDLTTALAPFHVFTDDFKNLVAMGEEGGNLPEVLGKHAELLNEEASYRLAALTKALGYLIRFGYIAFMVLMIFSIANIYFSMLSGFHP